MTFTASGLMLEFERRDDHRRGQPDHMIKHGLVEDEVRFIATDAGYADVDWFEFRANRVGPDATTQTARLWRFFSTAAVRSFAKSAAEQGSGSVPHSWAMR